MYSISITPSPRPRQVYLHFKAGFERLGGTMLALFGAKLMLNR